MGSSGPRKQGRWQCLSGWQRAQHEGDQLGSCHGLETRQDAPAPQAAAGTSSLALHAAVLHAAGFLDGPTPHASTLTWPPCRCVTSSLPCPTAPQESDGESPRSSSAGQRSWVPGLTPAGTARAKATPTPTRLPTRVNLQSTGEAEVGPGPCRPSMWLKPAGDSCTRRWLWL